MTSLFKKYPVGSFISLTFAISFLIGLPLKLFVLNPAFADSEIGLNYLSKIFITWGPALAAIMITLANEGKRGLLKLLTGLVPQSKHIIWWIAMPLAGLLITMLAFVITGYTFKELAWQMIKVSPLLFVMHFVAALLIIGIGEEIGWRGFLLPRLGNDYSLIKATFLLFIIWTAWHLPLFFSGYRVTLPFIVIVLAMSFIFTWLWEHTGRNIFVLAVAHASVDFPEIFFEGRMKGNPDSILTAWMVIGFTYLLIAAAIYLSTRERWNRKTAKA